MTNNGLELTQFCRFAAALADAGHGRSYRGRPVGDRYIGG